MRFFILLKGGKPFKMKMKDLREKLHDKKGVAGLDVFLSVITMIFVIGLLIMIYAMMGGELAEQVDDSTSSDNISLSVIQNTTDALSDATDFFGIIITITAMVVLILLTVIIIRAIRGSGLITAGTA